MPDESPPKKIPRTADVLQDIKAALADTDGVAVFVAAATTVGAGYETLLPLGGPAKWEADGMSFDFSGMTIQQIDAGLNQLANLLHRAAQGLTGLRGICGAYQSAARAHMAENAIICANPADIAAFQRIHKADLPKS